MKKLIFLTLLFFIACSKHSSVTDYANTKARYIFSDKNGLFGLLDENGKEVIPAEYLYIDKIKDGLIPAFTTQKEFVFLNETGKKIKDVKFRDIDRSYSEGLLAVSDIRSGNWGFVDKNLNYVAKPQFDTVDRFSNGTAEVRKDGLWGVINEKGDFIAKPEFKGIIRLDEGMTALKKETLWFVIDKNGLFVFPPQFDGIDGHSLGTMVVSKNGKFRVVDLKKAKVSEEEYDGFFGMTKGKAVLKKGSSIYLVTAENNKIFLMQDTAKEITYIFNSNGNAIGNNSFYLDYKKKDKKENHFVVFDASTGKKICDKVKPSFFTEMDENCNEKMETPHSIEITEDEDSKYENVRKSMCPEEKSISFKYKGKWGFLDENGKEVIPAEYDSVSAFYFGRTWVQKGEHYFVIDRNGKKIFEIDPEWRSFDELRYVKPVCYEWEKEKILNEDYWLPRRRIEKMFGKADPNPVLLKMDKGELLQKIIEQYSKYHDKESCYLLASKSSENTFRPIDRRDLSGIAEEMQKNDAEKFVEKFIEENKKSIDIPGLEKYSCEKDGIVSDLICYEESGNGNYDMESCLNKVPEHRIIKFSTPLYDPESDTVMVYREEYCGPLCGIGWLLFFEMRDGELSQTGSLFMFIS